MKKYQAGSLLFTITLGIVIIAVLIGMIFVATNTIKKNQSTKGDNQKNMINLNK